MSAAFTPIELESAVESGVITADVARSLRNFAAERQGAPLADDERFAGIIGLADVMTAIALVLLFGGIAATLSIFGPVAGLVMMGLSWAVAEYATRRRKMPITSVLLLGSYVMAAACGLLAVALLTMPHGGMTPRNAQGFTTVTPLAGLIVAGGTAMASAAYWYRFRIPLAYPVVAVAALNALTHVMRLVAPGTSSIIVSIILLAFGFIFLAIAMWWDICDVRRETRRSDIAFWMHWVAGCQLAGATFRLVMGVKGNPAGWDRLYVLDTVPAQGLVALAVIAVFALFCVVALIIDRRALMLSSLVFLVPSTASLFSDNPFVGTVSAAMLCGFALLLIAMRWRSVRRLLLARVPLVVRAQLPRSELTFSTQRPVA